MLKILSGIPGFAGLIMLLAAAPSGVHALTVTKATIEAGKLVVEGATREPKTKVKIDKTFRTRSNKKNLFSFSLAYHPEDCIVSVKEPGETDDVVIGNCGETGKRGRRGKRGFEGDAGEPGPQGLMGEKGETGNTGEKGEKGDKGDMGLQGLKGNKGDPGEDGAGAGKWWYQEESVSSTVTAPLKFENGQNLFRMRGFVACVSNGLLSGRIATFWSVSHYDSGPPGGTQFVEEIAPSANPSVQRPIVFLDGNTIKVKLDYPIELNVRCRIERLD